MDGIQKHRVTMITGPRYSILLQENFSSKLNDFFLFLDMNNSTFIRSASQKGDPEEEKDSVNNTHKAGPMNCVQEKKNNFRTSILDQPIYSNYGSIKAAS